LFFAATSRIKNGYTVEDHSFGLLFDLINDFTAAKKPSRRLPKVIKAPPLINPVP
jgi:hypothetical protein